MFTQNNNQFYVLPSGVKTTDRLPGGIYNMRIDQNGSLFLSKSEESFSLPQKLYGNVDLRSDRIIKTMISRKNKNTGVLLAGTKGSGKSMMAKKLGTEILQVSNEFGDGVVIIIGQEIAGPELDVFLQNIKQPCMVFLDEFEKIYDAEHQEKILTTMDGNLVINKLFVVTVNNIWKVNEHMINRPGRIFYNMTYKGLEQEFVEEYCADKLNDQKNTASIIRTSSVIDDFNFDMLQAIVEELNRFPESSYEECLDILNIVPSYFKKNQTKFLYKITDVNGIEVTNNFRTDSGTNPMISSQYLSFSMINSDDDEDCDGSDGPSENEILKSKGISTYYSMNTDDMDVENVNDDATVITLVDRVKNIKIKAFKIERSAGNKSILIA